MSLFASPHSSAYNPRIRTKSVTDPKATTAVGFKVIKGLPLPNPEQKRKLSRLENLLARPPHKTIRVKG